MKMVSTNTLGCQPSRDAQIEGAHTEAAGEVDGAGSAAQKSIGSSNEQVPHRTGSGLAAASRNHYSPTLLLSVSLLCSWRL